MICTYYLCRPGDYFLARFDTRYIICYNTGVDWWSKNYNWISGCERVSPACDHCWVPGFLHTMTLDKGKFAGATADTGDWSGNVTVLQDVLDRLEPLRWTKPQLVFVNIMSDTFHKDVPDHYVVHQLALAALLPQHIWMLCTKRERRLHALLNKDNIVRDIEDTIEQLAKQPAMARALASERASLPTQPLQWPLPNLWCGVTLESNKYSFRISKYLADTPAAVRFASCEPLMDGLADLDTGLLDWMIVGGEDLRPDQPGYRPMHPDWARDIRDRCADSHTAFWFKQWGSGYPIGQGGKIGAKFNNSQPGPTDLWLDRQGQISDQPHSGLVQIRRMHKRSAWRLLDGKEIFQVPAGWEEHPAVLAHAQHHGVTISSPQVDLARV